MKITFTNTISADDCNKLRVSAGWPQVHLDQIVAGLKNSMFIVAAKDAETTIGMARVVSDGGYVAFIVDVLVLPEYQRKGIGTAMMGSVMSYLTSTISDGYFVQVDLMAAKGKEAFYEKFVFAARPNDLFGCGMTQRMTKAPLPTGN